MNEELRPLKQGDVIYISLDPTIGSEQSGTRPAIVLSGDTFNRFSRIVLCAPLTSKIKNYQGNTVIQPDNKNNLSVPSECLVGNLRSIDRQRISKKLGKVSEHQIKNILFGLNVILDNE